MRVATADQSKTHTTQNGEMGSSGDEQQKRVEV